MAPFTILVTAAAGPLVPQAVRLMKASLRHDLRVVAVDIAVRGATRNFADAFLAVPPGNAPGYVDAVRAIVRQHGVDLVLPWSDEEALALSEARDVVEAAGATVACGRIALLRELADKAAAYAKLDSSGVRVAPWRVAGDRDSIAEAVRATLAASGSAVVKPARSRGGRNIFVIRSDMTGERLANYGREIHLDPASFLDRHLDTATVLAPVVVMERLFEPVYDVDVLAWQGTAHRVVARRRHNPGGVPFEGNDVAADERLVVLGRRTAAATGLDWLYDVDIMTDANGNPTLLEVNIRPSGSMPVSLVAGVPLIDDLVSLAKGEALPDMSPPAAQTVVPYVALSTGVVLEEARR